MRTRFTEVASRALDEDRRLALVLADIGVAAFADVALRHPRRVVNVGIREQLLIGVAAGFALEGYRPIVHSYTPFLVERPFEQLKLDLGHQGVGAVLVSIGASYDAAHEGRTHQAPEDVAVLASLRGWTIHVPGHADEVEALLRRALRGEGRAYLRLSQEENVAPVAGDGLVPVRRAVVGAPLVVAVGPTLHQVLAATADLDVAVAYLATVRPFDAVGLRELATGAEVVVVEPYLAGTSAAEVAAALVDHPHRVLHLGVRNPELRRYGTGAEHRAAHGLDARGIRTSLTEFLATPARAAA